MIVGFTGTHKGMNWRQRGQVRKLLRELKPVSAVHGGCVGADDDFDRLCHELDIPCRVRPSNIKGMTVKPRGKFSVVMPAKPPLDRNKDIVFDATTMIATPYEEEEIQRSGTWTTVRDTRKAMKPITIFFPSGRIKSYGHFAYTRTNAKH